MKPKTVGQPKIFIELQKYRDSGKTEIPLRLAEEICDYFRLKIMEIEQEKFIDPKLKIRDLEIEIMNSRKRNDELREALEFYAFNKNYDGGLIACEELARD